jgi:hypothetical protein
MAKITPSTNMKNQNEENYLEDHEAIRLVLAGFALMAHRMTQPELTPVKCANAALDDADALLKVFNDKKKQKKEVNKTKPHR